MTETPPDYSYSASLKSDASDELINTYILRPAAGVLVRLLYRSPITPNQVTIGAIIAGLIAAGWYWDGSARSTCIAGLCMTLKDLLDSADGQLARAKSLYSRSGRFLDSIGDLLVNVCAFFAFGFALWRMTGNPGYVALSAAALISTTLRVSYHVFYQTSFLHALDRYVSNRTTEEIRDEDREGERMTLRLQKLFQLLYGWQDRLMVAIDRWSAGGTLSQSRDWYLDHAAIRLSGFLGLGTELFILMAFSVANRMAEYLWINLLVLNAFWGITVLYRRVVLRRRFCGVNA